MYSDASLHDAHGDYQTILGLAADQRSRGRGYASLLLEKIIDLAREEKRKGVTIMCHDNLIGFYQKYGFNEDGISSSKLSGSLWYYMFLPLI